MEFLFSVVFLTAVLIHLGIVQSSSVVPNTRAPPCREDADVCPTNSCPAGTECVAVGPDGNEGVKNCLCKDGFYGDPSSAEGCKGLFILNSVDKKDQVYSIKQD